MVKRSKSFLFPISVELNPSLCKHGAHWHCICLTLFTLSILVTSDSYHHGSALSILLNGLIWPFSNVQVPLIGAVSVGVKPVRIIFGVVGTPPEIHRGVETICWLSYGIFNHTHAYGHGIPVGIISASQGGERWTFLVHPGGCIFWSLNLSTWCHKSQWCLFYWIFISRLCII